MARPVKKPFTAADDAAMVTMRAVGQSWQVIGVQLEQLPELCRRRFVSQHGKPPPVPPKAEPPVVSRRGHEPLPAGHPISWGAIALAGDPQN